jgi:hypothetical protein
MKFRSNKNRQTIASSEKLQGKQTYLVIDKKNSVVALNAGQYGSFIRMWVWRVAAKCLV